MKNCKAKESKKTRILKKYSMLKMKITSNYVKSTVITFLSLCALGELCGLSTF